MLILGALLQRKGELNKAKETYQEFIKYKNLLRRSLLLPWNNINVFESTR